MNKSHRPGADEWRPIIDGKLSSGLTVAAYCLDQGITQWSFYTWKRRLRSPAKPKRLPAPAFVEVKPNAPTDGAIEICLHGEWRLLVWRGFDRELLIDLKRIVLNRKNSLFVGNERDGQAVAIRSSLTSICKRHAVDPQRYLTQLVMNLPAVPISRLSDWLPEQWKLRNPWRSV